MRQRHQQEVGATRRRQIQGLESALEQLKMSLNLTQQHQFLSNRKEHDRKNLSRTSSIYRKKSCPNVSLSPNLKIGIKNHELYSGISCALVGDILLQGHLYVTENYLAFHSNVFGYVTRVSKRKEERTIKMSDFVLSDTTVHDFCDSHHQGEDSQDHPQCSGRLYSG